MRIYIVTIVFLLVDLLAVKLWLISPNEYLKQCFGHQVRVTGYIEPLSVKLQEDRASFIMDCESVRLAHNIVPYKNKLRVYLYNKNKQKALLFKFYRKLCIFYFFLRLSKT